jgi:hypothetical protein
MAGGGLLSEHSTAAVKPLTCPIVVPGRVSVPRKRIRCIRILCDSGVGDVSWRRARTVGEKKGYPVVSSRTTAVLVRSLLAHCCLLRCCGLCISLPPDRLRRLWSGTAPQRPAEPVTLFCFMQMRFIWSYFDQRDSVPVIVITTLHRMCECSWKS